MRTVRTILSISFLFLAASIVAGDREVSNELPDEINNLSQKKILNSILVKYKSDPNKSSTILPPIISVVVKLKFNRNGLIDTAVVVYCEEPNIGYEESALQTVLESTLKPKLRRRKVDKSWFYTEVVFNRIGYNPPIGTDSSSTTTVDGSKQDSSDFIPVEVQPELIIKGVPKYPRIARQKNIEAVVYVRVLVGITGRPLDAVIEKTTDPDWQYGFNKSALKSAMKCHFKPATQDGKPVKVWVSFPYEFKLR